MNKALHALVYVILVIAAAALYFEYNLYGKKELLKDRNRQLEDYLVKLSNTIEKSDAAKPTTLPEALKDVSPVEAKLVDTPETENVLEEYQAQLEEQNLETMKWDDKERMHLRQYYKVDGEGNRIPDAANPGDYVKKGPGTAQALLDQLFDRAKAQQAKLNTTRAALAEMRTKVEGLVAEYNKIKPECRQEKVAVEEKKGQVSELEQDKASAQEQLTKVKGQIDDLNAEIKSLKDEVASAKDETEAVREDLQKKTEYADKLKELLKNTVVAPAQRSSAAASADAVLLTAGCKGKIIDVNTKLMFAIVELNPDAIAELLGPDRQNPLRPTEMGLRRKGFQGPAGEYVGRIRLRQAVQNKNFVIADILGDWQQAQVQKGDEVFAE